MKQVDGIYKKTRYQMTVTREDYNGHITRHGYKYYWPLPTPLRLMINTEVCGEWDPQPYDG